MRVRWVGPRASPWLYVMAPGDCGELEDVSGSVIAGALAGHGVRVVRFAAPPTGGDSEWVQAIAKLSATHHPGQCLVLGGQSRGARVSVSLAPVLGAQALWLWSYPFHPRRSPTSLSALHALAGCPVPVWLGQGSRDALGNREQIRGYSLPSHVQVHWVEDANHDLVPRARTGLHREDVLRSAVDVLAASMLSS